MQGSINKDDITLNLGVRTDNYWYPIYGAVKNSMWKKWKKIKFWKKTSFLRDKVWLDEESFEIFWILKCFCFSSFPFHFQVQQIYRVNWWKEEKLVTSISEIRDPKRFVLNKQTTTLIRCITHTLTQWAGYLYRFIIARIRYANEL